MIRRGLVQLIAQGRASPAVRMMPALMLVGGMLLGGCASTPPAYVADPAATTSPHSTWADELVRYHRDLRYICDASGTPADMIRRHDALVQALNDAGYGFGRSSNFVGVPRPEQVRAGCDDYWFGAGRPRIRRRFLLRRLHEWAREDKRV